MNIFEKPAGTSWANHKGFEKRGIKIRPASGDSEIEKLLCQSRLPIYHIGYASFSCIFSISGHRFNEINGARP